MSDPDDRDGFARYGPEARYAVEAEAQLPTAAWEREVERGLELAQLTLASHEDAAVERVLPHAHRAL